MLVIGDDHGYTDFGFMGSREVQTPNLDRLAAEGTVFPVAYTTASQCRPALRTLLSGLYPHQWGLRVAQIAARVGRADGVRDVELFDTLPRALERHGYATFEGGKLWEGTFADAGFGGGMTDRFEPSAFPRLRGQFGGDGLALVRETMDPVFEFVDAHTEQPFFLWFAPFLPHLPHDAPPRFRDLYRNAEISGRRRAYYAAVSWFDEGVGRLVEHLERRGLREKTLIVYLADNGWEVDDEAYRAEGGPHGKNSLYELGFRTPLVFHWPGHIESGAVRDALASFVDVVPTLLDYAGAPPLRGRPGRSLRPQVEGREGAGRHALIGAAPRSRAGPGGVFLRDERWHFVAYDGRPPELYDLSEDPREQRNVAGEHPDRVRDYRERIAAWQRETHRGFGPRADCAFENGHLECDPGPG